MRARSILCSVAALCASLLPLQPALAVEVVVTEFYNTTLKHYVLITDPAEAAAIDQGAAGPGWERTGGTLAAYSAPGDAAGLVPVCRFYGSISPGPNSHFFTADPAECAAVKLDPGWHYEGIAFYIQLPANRLCANPLKPVWRAYNNGFRPPPGFNDGNHRFSTDHTAIEQLVAQGWTDEGIVFCATGGTPPGPVVTSGECLLPVPGSSSTFSVSGGSGLTQAATVTGTAAAPLLTATTQVGGLTTVAKTQYTVAQQPARKVLSWTQIRTEFGGLGIQGVIEVSDGGSLPMAMTMGMSAGNSGPVTGSYSITGPGVSCGSPVTGSFFWEYTFLGRETVTVPAGTFNACRFRYHRATSYAVTCTPGFGAGAADDTLTLWAAEGVGMVKSQNQANGSTVELVSFTP